MGSPQIFNFWGERKQQSPNDASVIHCDLLAERESTAKTFLRFSIAASAQQMHLLLPILVLCSAIFRRVFLALRSPRSLREPLLQLRCHHLALATQLALAQKSTFLKIFLLIYPSYTLPSSAERRAGEDRENNGTTPRQQKVLFVNICHRHWLFSARGYPREFPSGPLVHPELPPPVQFPAYMPITPCLYTLPPPKKKHFTPQLCCPPPHPLKAHNLCLAHSTSRSDSTATWPPHPTLFHQNNLRI